MDLEIVGRHALLFDDDATAEVVNSGGSLVPWAAVGAADLLLDRHDVRHLLDRVPPRPRRAYSVALLSAPSPDGVSETELDRERYLDLPAGDGEYEGSRDAANSGNGTDTGHADYNAVPFSYGYPAGSDEPSSSDLCYLPSFYVPESLLNKLPPSEKVHQIIARTALFVSEHGGQSEIVLRVKQGDNPTFGFLMPDHHLHSYFRYLVDHPQLLKDGADAVGTDKRNTESEHASSGGALSLLGTAYDSEDEAEGTLPRSSEGMNPGNSMTPDVQGHVKSASIMPDKKELGKDQNAAVPAVKSKTILTKKNPIITSNTIVAVQREKVNDTITASTISKSHINSGLSETKEMILEPPSFMKRTMEKIIEFILTNGKEFEEKLIEQDRTTGRFPFLLSSNPYHSYYLKFLQETEESKSRGTSPNHKDRRGSSDWRGRRSPESDDRSSRERADRSSHERADRSSRERVDRSSRERGDRRCSMERKDSSYGMVSCASDRSSARPSKKQLYDKQGKGRFHPVCGVKKEPTRKVTADEAAAIVMAATRGLGAANDSLNTMKGTKDNVRTHVSNDPSSSFGSFSSLQDRDALSKHISNSEADASLTSSGQPQKEGFGIIDDDWIANTIAKAAAAAASKEADSSEASMTKEQKLKAERLRRAKMFAAIIKSGDNKMNDLAAASDPTSEAAKAIPDTNISGLDLQSVAKEREGSSAPFEHEGPNLTKHNKDSDDEQNRVRKYRKKHQESDEEEDESEDSYKQSRKRHRPEHSRARSKDVHKHKHKSRSKDRESRHRRHRFNSSEDEQEQEQERRSSKSRHRHRDDHRYSDEEEHRRSHKHWRREHHSSSKRKLVEDRDQSEQSQGRLEVSRTYTATADDIGHVLRFECIVVDVETRGTVRAPTSVMTSRVIPAPTPTPRRLIPVNAADAMGHFDLDSRTSSFGTFTVLSYNILADTYATSDTYSYCPTWALTWAYRRQNLLREIIGYHADIICLQEVQSNHFEEFFSPELDKHGYQALYKKRTTEVYTGSPQAIDGCATFFRRDRFSHVKKYEVEFNKAAQSLTDAIIPAAQKKLALTRLVKDNIALIAVLEAKFGNHGTENPSKRQLLCVANTHINIHHDLKDVKLWQIHTLLKGLEKIAVSADIPMLVCGDFNSTPGSTSHWLLARGKVDHLHPDLAIDPLGILRPLSKLTHQLPLVSAYSSFVSMAGVGYDLDHQRRRMDPATNEPLFTNCTRDFTGTIDYIFYTADSLTVESLLELLNEDSLRKDTALPSPEWSSDHIALLAEFRCKPRVRR